MQKDQQLERPPQVELGTESGRVHLLDVLEDLLALVVVLAEPAHDLGRRQQVNRAGGFSQPGLEGSNPLVNSRKLVWGR